MAIKILIYHFVSPSFKFTFKIIVVLCLHLAHSISCSFTNIMPRRDPVRSICWPSDYGSGYKDGPELICCVEGRQPQIHEVWIFGENGDTLEVFPTARVDVGDFVGDFLLPISLLNIWRRIPMFVRNSINGRVKWISVPNFLRNDGTPWTLNLLDPYTNLGGRGSSTSLNLVSGSGGYFDGVSINWNQPTCVLRIYHQRIFENTCSAACRARDNISMENCTYRMQSSSTCRHPSAVV